MHCDIINRMFPKVLRFPDQCWKQLLNFLAQSHPIDQKLWFQTIELFHALWYQRNTISKSLFSSDFTSTLTKYFIPGSRETKEGGVNAKPLVPSPIQSSRAQIREPNHKPRYTDPWVLLNIQRFRTPKPHESSPNPHQPGTLEFEGYRGGIPEVETLDLADPEAEAAKP